MPRLSATRKAAQRMHQLSLLVPREIIVDVEGSVRRGNYASLGEGLRFFLRAGWMWGHHPNTPDRHAWG